MRHCQHIEMNQRFLPLPIGISGKFAVGGHACVIHQHIHGDAPACYFIINLLSHVFAGQVFADHDGLNAVVLVEFFGKFVEFLVVAGYQY